MRYPVGLGTQQDFDRYWYNADPWNTYRQNGSYYHGGADLNLKTGGNSDCGQPLYAVADGEITHTESLTTGFGRHLHLKCEGEWGVVWFHYAHCSEILVKAGDKVKEGQLIAKLGSTGNSAYCHLHFEGKKKAVGVNAVAKTKQQLEDGWFDPISFIKEWMNKTPPQEPSMALSDNTKKLLGVQTEEALVHKIIEHVGLSWGSENESADPKYTGGYLGGDRRKIKELEGESVKTAKHTAKLETQVETLLAEKESLKLSLTASTDRNGILQDQIDNLRDQVESHVCPPQKAPTQEEILQTVEISTLIATLLKRIMKG